MLLRPPPLSVPSRLTGGLCGRVDVGRNIAKLKLRPHPLNTRPPPAAKPNHHDALPMFSATTLPIRCAAATAAAAVRPRAATAVRPCLSSSCYSTKAAATHPRPSQLLKLPTGSPIAAARCSTASAPRCSSSITARLISSTRSARAAEANTLTWNRFLALRKTRRRLSLFCSIAAAIASTAVGVNLVLGYDVDSLGAQTFGLDPFIVMGLSTVACGCVGWLLGPAIGDGMFRLVYRKIGRQIVEVSFSSLSNLTPPRSMCYDKWVGY